MNSIKKIKKTDNLEFFTVSVDSKKEIPFIDTMVSAGFPSPADDYLDSVSYTHLTLPTKA